MKEYSDSVSEVVSELSVFPGLDIRQNEPLSRHTTLKVGGPADLLLYPKSLEELQFVMKVVTDHYFPWRVIGRGSNLLVRDGGIRGVVIRLDEGFNDYKVKGTCVTVGGGFSTIRLASIMTKNGLTGLEFAGGIPGNIGGAVYMNAGAHGSEISQVLFSAEVLLPTGKIVTLSNEELKFCYRTSILQKEVKGIVTQATFQLSYGAKEEIVSNLAGFKDYRKKTQPLQFPCAGSVFRNPPGNHAGRLIEESGLKGYQVGGAEVSTMHGNFIINRGSATAKDVLSLINHIIQTIDENYNIKLKPEVQVVGEE